MPKKNFDQQLAVLEGLRREGLSPSGVEILRKAISNPNNYIVSKAAQIAAEQEAKALIPDLLAALDRFYTNPSKTDPQCWAKNGLVAALASLGYYDSSVYLQGLHHVQMEPVWGGQQDTAGALRGKCAMALVECRDLSDLTVLSHLVELLVDPEKNVRVEAACAIGRIDRPEAALLLHLKALTGDRESEVTGACFTAVLSVEGDAGVGFVSRFLEQPGDVAEEAALALGALRSLRAFEALQGHWEHAHGRWKVLLTAMALTRQPQAVEFVVQTVAADGPHSAAAIEALAAACLPDEVRERAASAVESTGNPRLRAAFHEHFNSRTGT